MFHHGTLISLILTALVFAAPEYVSVDYNGTETRPLLWLLPRTCDCDYTCDANCFCTNLTIGDGLLLFAVFGCLSIDAMAAMNFLILARHESRRRLRSLQLWGLLLQMNGYASANSDHRTSNSDESSPSDEIDNEDHDHKDLMDMERLRIDLDSREDLLHKFKSATSTPIVDVSNAQSFVSWFWGRNALCKFGSTLTTRMDMYVSTCICIILVMLGVTILSLLIFRHRSVVLLFTVMAVSVYLGIELVLTIACTALSNSCNFTDQLRLTNILVSLESHIQSMEKRIFTASSLAAAVAEGKEKNELENLVHRRKIKVKELRACAFQINQTLRHLEIYRLGNPLKMLFVIPATMRNVGATLGGVATSFSIVFTFAIGEIDNHYNEYFHGQNRDASSTPAMCPSSESSGVNLSHMQIAAICLIGIGFLHRLVDVHIPSYLHPLFKRKDRDQKSKTSANASVNDVAPVPKVSSDQPELEMVQQVSVPSMRAAAPDSEAQRRRQSSLYRSFCATTYQQLDSGTSPVDPWASQMMSGAYDASPVDPWESKKLGKVSGMSSV